MCVKVHCQKKVFAYSSKVLFRTTLRTSVEVMCMNLQYPLSF